MNWYFIALFLIIIYLFWENRTLNKKLYRNKKMIEELNEKVSAMKHNNEANRKRLRFYGWILLKIVDNKSIDLGYSNMEKAQIWTYIREPHWSVPDLEN